MASKNYYEATLAAVENASGEDIRDAVWMVVKDLNAGKFSPAQTDELLAVCDSRATGMPLLRKDIAQIRLAVDTDTVAAAHLAYDLCGGKEELAPEPVAVVPMPEAPVVLMLDPEAMLPHPLLDRMMMLDKVAGKLRQRAKTAGHNRRDMLDAAEEAYQSLDALKASVAAQGVIEPLLVVATEPGQYRIIDGRHRWTAALAAGLRAVPCIVRDEADAGQIIADSVTGRRHFTKSALAWIAVLTHPEVATEAKAGNPNFSNPAKLAELEKGSENMAALATRHGVSLRLIEDACRLYRILETHRSLREKYELSIWAGAGLTALAGQAAAESSGKIAVAGQEAQSAKYKLAEALAGALTDLADRFTRRYGQCDEEAKAAVRMAAEKFAREAPADIRETMLAAWSGEA